MNDAFKRGEVLGFGRTLLYPPNAAVNPSMQGYEFGGDDGSRRKAQEMLCHLRSYAMWAEKIPELKQNGRHDIVSDLDSCKETYFDYGVAVAFKVLSDIAQKHGTTAVQIPKTLNP